MDGGGDIDAMLEDAGDEDDPLLATALRDEARRIGLRAGPRNGRSAELTSRVKQILHVFIEDDPTLALDKNAAANAEAIAARVRSETAGCVSARVTVEPGSATVSVDFGTGCATTSSVTISGTARATVRISGDGDGGGLRDGGARDAGAGRTITVELSLDVTVDGYQLRGSATVSTSDLIRYALGFDMALTGIGQVTFSGTAILGTAAPAAITVDGTGIIDPTAPPDELTLTGWTCTGATSAPYTLRGLHRDLSACAADRGELEAVETYECKKASLRRDAGAQVATAKLKALAKWSSETPTTGEIAVSVTMEWAGTTQTVEASTVKIQSCE